MQMPRALLFSTGYQANIGAVTALAGPEDAIFSDALNHASLIDGVRLSRAHGVFTSDGAIAPLPPMLDLCERHDAWLLVDDAHGFGVIGPEGRGAPAHFGPRLPRLVYVRNLCKEAQEG